MKILKNYYFIGVLILALTFFLIYWEKAVKKEEKLAPASTILNERVAGIGVVEPKNKVIKIGAQMPGIIETVHVSVGDYIKAGDPLFTIDTRNTKVQLEKAEANYIAKKIELEDIKDHIGHFKKTTYPVISKEELARKLFKVQYAEALLHEAEVKIKELKTILDCLTVKAPENGKILQMNARIGEYAETGTLSNPLIIMGDTTVLYVRVEIDENDVHRISGGESAVGSLYGQGEKMIPLQFVRLEPILKPKHFLSGNGNQRIDTRIMEVIYSLPEGILNVYPEQQMDVFIELTPTALTAKRN